MTPTAGRLILHLLAIYAIFLAPWVAYRKMARRAPPNAPGAKVRMYQRILVQQGLITAVVASLWGTGVVAAARLGVGPPRSWWLTGGLAGASVLFLVGSGLRLRARAEHVRRALQDRGGFLLPQSRREVRWFAAVSLGSGLAEELTYRGFLFYYLTLWAPSLNAWLAVLITSIIFGVAHIYQGWRGVAASAVAGVILGVLFVVTGNLLVPIIVHSLGNFRGAIILWPGTPSGADPDAARQARA